MKTSARTGRPRPDLSQPLSEQLRQAIDSSGHSLYELAKLSGVDSGRLSRFVRAERTITMDAADRLGHALRLRLARR